ncbi:MAG: hypothetical protein D8M58_18655 [Calditrichaeota bacterium]|nr:MAG: hypothetical protein DWQ03_21335 [Calditrichota bacterium]MBL1207431.1 hypothetical protein [Calditrichota bacterium]NOG47263.1 hypothetical protein [Calditrichota bacterium]
MRHFTFLIIIVFGQCLQAQDGSTKNFIGINPSITVEPFYEQGEFDINILPVVYQKPINNFVDVRLTSILSLGIRDKQSGINGVGFETAAPIFLNKREKDDLQSKGFFIASIFSLVRYTKEEHTNFGFWLEPGYIFSLDNDFSISIGGQFGATYFDHDKIRNKWGEHIGAKFIIGKWF